MTRRIRVVDLLLARRGVWLAVAGLAVAQGLAGVVAHGEEVVKYDDAASVLKALRDIRDELQHADKLIIELGDPNFHVRQRATKQLIDAPLLPSGVLRRATQNEDPEIVWRAQRVMQHRHGKKSVSVYHLLQAVRDEKIQGIANELAALAGACEGSDQAWLFVEAYVSAIRAEDYPACRKHIGSDSPLLRRASVAAIAALARPDAEQDLRRCWNDPDDQVRIAVASGLAQLGNPASLDLLVELMESEDVKIATLANTTLTGMVRVDFDFSDARTPQQRQAAVARWRDWLGQPEHRSIRHRPKAPISTDSPFE